MIKSFAFRETEKIFNGEFSIKFPNDIQRRALSRLLILDAAVCLNDLIIPKSNNLEKLQGNLKELYIPKVFEI